MVVKEAMDNTKHENGRPDNTEESETDSELGNRRRKILNHREGQPAVHL